MQAMQRRATTAEHLLRKAELRVRSAELRAQSAESELIQLRRHHAVSLSVYLASNIDMAPAVPDSNTRLFMSIQLARMKFVSMPLWMLGKEKRKLPFPFCFGF